LSVEHTASEGAKVTLGGRLMVWQRMVWKMW